MKRFLDYNKNWRFFPEASGLSANGQNLALDIINSQRLTLKQKKERMDNLLMPIDLDTVYNSLADIVKVEITTTLPDDIDVFVDGFWMYGGQKKVVKREASVLSRFNQYRHCSDQ